MSDLISEASFIPRRILEARYYPPAPRLKYEGVELDIGMERMRPIFRTNGAKSSQNDNSAEMMDRCKRADIGGR